MTSPSLKIIGTIKKCSATQDELIAHIQAFDKKPEPIQTLVSSVVEAIAPKRRGRPPKQDYKTRDMRAEA